MTEFTEYEIQLRYDGTYNGIELRLHTWGYHRRLDLYLLKMSSFMFPIGNPLLRASKHVLFVFSILIGYWWRIDGIFMGFHAPWIGFTKIQCDMLMWTSWDLPASGPMGNIWEIFGETGIWLVVWNMNGWFFHSVRNFIIPTDELIFFTGVGITPTREYFEWI